MLTVLMLNFTMPANDFGYFNIAIVCPVLEFLLLLMYLHIPQPVNYNNISVSADY